MRTYIQHIGDAELFKNCGKVCRYELVHPKYTVYGATTAEAIKNLSDKMIDKHNKQLTKKKKIIL